MADAPAGQARRLRRRHRRVALACARSSTSPSARSTSTGRSTSRSIRATSAPPRSTTCAATPAKARKALGWKPKVTFHELIQMMVRADEEDVPLVAGGPRAHVVSDRGGSEPLRSSGARGTLGQALVEELPRAGWTLALAADRAVCDLRDAASLRAVVARGFGGRRGVVFNAAAYTDVDRAESEPDAAFAANALAPETLARAADAAGRRAGPLLDRLRLRRRARAPLRRVRSAVAAGALRALEGRGRAAGRRGDAAALHPARRLPLRAGRAQLSLDDPAPPARGRDRARRPRAARLADLGAARWRVSAALARPTPIRPLSLHVAGRDQLGRLRALRRRDDAGAARRRASRRCRRRRCP